MTRTRQIAIWTVGLVVFVGILLLLQGILLPFVIGLLIAYLLDPVADRIEGWGCSRAVAVCLILLTFFTVSTLALFSIVPILQAQGTAFIATLPDIVAGLRKHLEPLLQLLWEQFGSPEPGDLQSAIRDHADSAVGWITRIMAGIWSGGQALLDIISLLVITPLVAFYLLRDWDRMTAFVDGLLPRDFAPTLRLLADEMDTTIAGYLRGQSSVCLILSVLYAVALGLLGLKFGLLIGLFAGLISFIPYVGAAVGLLLSVGVAIAQYTEVVPVLLVAGVFGVGQIIEGSFLTPTLVGDSIGLHPVWLLFALMAGGLLLGFTGILISLPVAAVVGVLVRFWVNQYRQSTLFLGSKKPSCCKN
jgi:predicted PurR-regulated permease PerM